MGKQVCAKRIRLFTYRWVDGAFLQETSKSLGKVRILSSWGNLWGFF